MILSGSRIRMNIREEMKTLHNKRKKQVLIVGLFQVLFIVAILSFIVYTVNLVGSEVQERGLKGIVEDIWEGNQTDSITE